MSITAQALLEEIARLEALEPEKLRLEIELVKNSNVEMAQLVSKATEEVAKHKKAFAAVETWLRTQIRAQTPLSPEESSRAKSEELFRDVFGKPPAPAAPRGRSNPLATAARSCACGPEECCPDCCGLCLDDDRG